MKNKIITFDFDGVLADSSNRYQLAKTEPHEKPRIDLQHWRDNSHKVAEDLPIAENIALYNAAIKDPTVVVVIATARVWCELSDRWVFDHLDAFPDYLSHRINEEDQRPANDIKGVFVASLLQIYKSIKTVVFYDDNLEYLKQFKQAIPHAETIHILSNQGY
jgi:FMN phosphatase YigB (HAD superfamily)